MILVNVSRDDSSQDLGRSIFLRLLLDSPTYLLSSFLAVNVM
jgi:hypothetical protein